MKKWVSGENLLPRVVCLVLACCLWLYVMSEQNPIVERSYVVNLEQRNLSEGMLVYNAPAKVSVKVRGSRITLGDLKPESITAYVNLDKMKVGQHTATVVANFSQGEVLEISPKTVNLYLDVSKEKAFPVTTRVVGAPAADLTLGKRIVSPAEVKVKGAAHRVDAVDKVIAALDVSDRKEDFMTHVTLIAMSVDGVEIPDVTIEPSIASVEAKMVRQMVTMDLPITAKTSGKLPAGLKLLALELVPPKGKFTGSPSLLDKFTSFETEPIDLSKVTGNTALKTTLRLPEGITGNVNTVEVRISVEGASTTTTTQEAPK